MEFSVSVIIPAFNVERFIEKAITSAFNNKHVFEVIAVNDGSTDNTLKVLNKLKANYQDRLTILQHEGGINKGRSATRNLGVKNAKANYVAFLDADDFYLENRFRIDFNTFNTFPETDVVYHAVGFHFYRKLLKHEVKNFSKLNTVTKPLEQGNVFKALLSSKYGYLHLNGLTVKASVFKEIGYFNENLEVAEDSDFIFKLGFKCNFKAGEIINPVALRGIHNENIFDNEELYQTYNIKLYESILKWCYKENASLNQIDEVLKWLWVIKFRENKSLIQYIIYWVGFSFRFPKTIFSTLFIKYFPMVRLRKKLFPLIFP